MTSDAGTVVSVCPACGGQAGKGGQDVPFRDIWDALSKEFSVDIPRATRAKYTSAPQAQLRPCLTCGLRFFVGAIAGGPDFYELLDSGPGYYNALTWEGQFVVGRVASEEDVVDLGSGAGALLRALLPRTGRTVGVDHHGDAIASLVAAGIEGHVESFSEFAETAEDAFDVALAMQVLEHLPHAAPLFDAAHRVLRSSGRLFVAVPNADRVVERFEPLDCPPHHVTRWTVGDVERLADRHSFDVVRFHFEPGARGALRRALRARLPGAGGVLLSRAVAGFAPEALIDGLVERLAPGANTAGHTLLAELMPRSNPRV